MKYNFNDVFKINYISQINQDNIKIVIYYTSRKMFIAICFYILRLRDIYFSQAILFFGRIRK